ncbi:hypothetical protein BCR35DRAFT_3615 [Leucosporidium creatinivorum]|uniref:Uncharacterized protein n=1 Tax=Leucosporidium creatinivorum TaxID=106004 RepID=A0A1Y2G3N2_9BASI|nr:hypothetical protein BCR35DRAFT_3615 [Leucosporidium creatinivorum]
MAAYHPLSLCLLLSPHQSETRQGMDYSWEGSIISLSDSCTSSASATSPLSTRPCSPSPTTLQLILDNATSISHSSASHPHPVAHHPSPNPSPFPSPTAPTSTPHSPTAPSPPSPPSRARDSPSPHPYRRQRTRTSTAGSSASDAGSSASHHSSSGAGSSEEEGEGEGEGEAHASDLRMPSMRIRRAGRDTSRDVGAVRGRSLGEGVGVKGIKAESPGGRPTPSTTTILLVGKTRNERQVLARLLSSRDLHPSEEREHSTDDGHPSADAEPDDEPGFDYMSASFLSTTSAGASLSDRSTRSSSSSHRLSSRGAITEPPASAQGGDEAEHEVFSLLPSSSEATGLTFLQPSHITDLPPTSLLPSQPLSTSTATTELLTALRTPLEQLEVKLNPSYPTSRGLGDLVGQVFASSNNSVDACFMLMSSRTPSPSPLSTPH